MKELEYLRGKKVFASFSGGADSCALLLLLNEHRQSIGYDLEAVHFDHGLRGADVSARETEFCRGFCAERKIKLTIVRLNMQLAGESSGTESLARQLRFEQWDKIIGDRQHCVIALAHHADDRLENFFMRFCRGGNISSLNSPRPHQRCGRFDLFRPLLGLRKKQLLQILEGHGVSEFCHDRTNDDAAFATRNYFRHKIIKPVTEKLHYAEDGMLQSLKVLTEDAQFIEHEAQRAFLALRRKGMQLDTEELRGLPNALLVRVLRMFVSEVTGTDFIPSADFVERFKRLLESGCDEQKLLEIAQDYSLVFQKKTVGLQAKGRLPLEPLQWQWRKNPGIEFGGNILRARFESAATDGIGTAAFDADLLPDTLIVSQRQKGDRMIPFARNSAVSIKKLFTDAKIPACEQHDYPVLRDTNNNILWLAGVRRSNLAPVSDKTVNIICFTLEKKHLKR